MTNWILEYADKLKSGKEITSKRVKKIYLKLAEEIRNPDPNSEWIYDESRADKPIEFIEQFCKHSKGEWMGRDVELDLFQKAFIAALFGFVHKLTGVRRFKETFFLVARKNGKSTLLSGIMLYMQIADGEGGAQVVSAATKRDQAAIVFNECVNMVRQSPYLSKHLKKRKSDIYFPLTFSTMNPLSSDSNTLDGLNLHLAVIDELHAIKDRNLYEVLKQGMSARNQPLLVMITTAGTVRESIYDDMYEYAAKVADGVIKDERFLPVLYELDDKKEWSDWKCWKKANPGLGTIKKVEFMSEQVERAKNNPKDLPGILTKDFNVRETVAGAWLAYDEVNNETTFDLEDVRGSYAIGGADLSSTTDLTCATLILMKPGNDTKYVIQQYFLPEEGLEKRIIDDKIPYDKWRDRGLLTVTEGARVDYTQVTQWFIKMINEYDIRPLYVGFDSWNAQYWTLEMKDIGFDMVEVRQGYKTLSTPMKELESEFRMNQVIYNNNPILKWCLTNTSVKTDENGNIRPVKGVSQRQRIDGMVSLLIAYVVLHQNYENYRSML
ncbi:terminase large subunit [Exiguobacterium profundum]|uniref:Terminase large subunit n=1 Tax=Exiguobacterium profundum TaxID=307643 RepID=A0ABY8B6K5_9BACL|nr:terminase TerL endonuclease subunit [Exiguobacterium profundum]WED56174.1 terminase large subunit [Exiguobacterium profundum]